MIARHVRRSTTSRTGAPHHFCARILAGVVTDSGVERKEDVLTGIELPQADELLSHREGDPATAAVEERLLQPSALSKRDRPLSPTERQLDEARLCERKERDEFSSGKLLQHARRLRRPLEAVSSHDRVGRLALHAGVAFEKLQQRGRVLLEAWYGQHQLARAAEAPLIEKLFERSARRRVRGIGVEPFENLAALQRLEEVSQSGIRPDHSGKLPDLDCRDAAHDSGEPLQQAVVERRLVGCGERSVQESLQDAVADHRGSIGERRVGPAVTADLQKTPKLTGKLGQRESAELLGPRPFGEL